MHHNLTCNGSHRHFSDKTIYCLKCKNFPLGYGRIANAEWDNSCKKQKIRDLSWQLCQIHCFSFCYISTVCSVENRNSSFSPVLALLSISCCGSPGSPQREESHPHALYPPQENRQFGSKMTDSKYFTTTKKGKLAWILPVGLEIKKIQIMRCWGLFVNIFQS